MSKEPYPLEEAARLLKCCKKSVTRKVAKGILLRCPSGGPGSKVLIAAEGLDAILRGELPPHLRPTAAAGQPQDEPDDASRADEVLQQPPPGGGKHGGPERGSSGHPKELPEPEWLRRLKQLTHPAERETDDAQEAS